MKYLKKYYFPILLLLLTLLSIGPYCLVKFNNYAVNFCLQILIIFYLICFVKNKSYLSKYKVVLFFLFWVVICGVRGIFIAENYWDWKNLSSAFLSMLLSLIIYYIDSPSNFYHVFKYLMKRTTFLFVFLFCWIIKSDAVHYFLPSFLIFICFIPIMSKKWKFISLLVAFMMLFRDIDGRSQILSAMASLCIAFALSIYRRGRCSFVVKNLKCVHWIFHIIPLVLIVLGVTGVFNVFEGFSENSLKNEKTYYINSEGNLQESNAAADTRTFIYVDVINSAIKNDYILFGRTLARGNDCTFRFGDDTFLLTGRYERFANEVGMTNIFTWLGVVGLVLYIAMYLRASWLGLYRSQNIYIKLIACLVAYHCMYGWIENYPAFTMHTVILYVMIAMCMSPSFRKMSNTDFEILIKNILK